MGKAIGIDLGTTNTVAAEMRTGRKAPIPLTSSDGGMVTRSVVAYRAGTWLVGQQAEEIGKVAPLSVVASSKRFIGLRYGDQRIAADTAALNTDPARPRLVAPPEGEFGVRIRLYPGNSSAPVEISPIEVATRILTKAVEDAEQAIGPVTHAVITVPAYFDAARIEATRQAGQDAGLVVQRIISEPLAAALAYGMNLDNDTVETILVFDLGGGTFDVTVAALGGGNCVELAKQGNNHLGGDDFDARLEQLVIRRLREVTGIDLAAPAAQQGITEDALLGIRYELRCECRKKKEALSNLSEVAISPVWSVHPRAGALNSEAIKVTRREFEALIADKVDETLSLTEQTLAEASCTPEQIDRILLVGGSTFIPLIRERLRARFGADKVQLEVDPMQAVALGAAILALTLPRNILCPQCRTDQPADSPVCKHCGCPLKIGPQLEAPAPADVPPMQLVSTIARTISIETLEGELVPVFKRGAKYSPTDGAALETRRLSLRVPRSGMDVAYIPFYEGEAPVASEPSNTFLDEVIYRFDRDIRQGEEILVETTLNGDGTLAGRVTHAGRSVPYVISPTQWRKDLLLLAQQAQKLADEMQDSPARSQLIAVVERAKQVAPDSNAQPGDGKKIKIALLGAIGEGGRQGPEQSEAQATLQRSIFMASALCSIGKEWVDKLPLISEPHLRDVMLSESKVLGTVRTALVNARHIEALRDEATAPQAAQQLDELIHSSQLLWPLTFAQLISEMASGTGDRRAFRTLITPEQLERIRQREASGSAGRPTSPEAIRHQCAQEIAQLLPPMKQTITLPGSAFDTQFGHMLDLMDQYFAAD